MKTPSRSVSVLAALLTGIFSLYAENIKGTVVDPDGLPISGAQIALANRVGIIAQRTSGSTGEFDLPGEGAEKVIVTAAGFETKAIELPATAPLTVRLALSPQTDSIRVSASTIDVPASEQGSSVSVISREELRGRNEAQAFDLIRYLPGLVIAQSGPRGSAASLFVRGGDSKYNLVQIDGVPVNSFYQGGYFDFAHVPADFLDRIEVVRGPQSAVYGSYAIGSVVNFVTRSPESGPALDIVAEGGSHQEHRFAVTAAGMVRGFGVSASASRLDDNGVTANSDYRNENLLLNAGRNWGRQHFWAMGNFNSNETGEPGPYGSDPAHLSQGIDRISRSKNNFSDYLLHYQIDVAPRVREELFGSFFLNNNFYRSPYGGSFNKDLRGQGETRTILNLTRTYTMAAGLVFAREELKNNFVTDGSSRVFPLRRDQEGLYWENRFQFASRLFLNAGLRAEFFQTARIPAAPSSPFFVTRPELAPYSLTKVNPKVAIAYVFPRQTRVHGSFGTGIRPAGGADLAFSNNPTLKPERTVSFDLGVDQRFFHDRLSVEATYFYNRYFDLIVGLGGNLSRLSAFQTDNVSNARAQGAEFVAQVRPARWIFLTGSYTYLDSQLLALTGSGGLAQKYFTVGKSLIRRPKDSGAMTSSFQYRKLTANIVAYWRGETLDIEPNFGAAAGLYNAAGYQNLGVNLNYAVGGGLAVYGSLRNALNQRYEEVFGYPAPALNFVSGVKWSLGGGKR